MLTDEGIARRVLVRSAVAQATSTSAWASRMVCLSDTASAILLTALQHPRVARYVFLRG